MTFKEKIQKDLNEALKSGQALASVVLRMLLAAILNKEKEKRYKLKEEKDVLLTDEETMETIISEIKKRKEAISEYERGERRDLAEKEKKEMIILQKYLPAQLSQEELKGLIKEAIAKVGAQEQKDMGKVMSELMGRIKGRADVGAVSKIVKELLS